MDVLKGLPSHDGANFSNYTQGLAKVSVKSYIRLKGTGPEEKPSVIVTDTETLLRRELEREFRRCKRKSLKRTSDSVSSNDCKIVKTADSVVPTLDNEMS